jgi:predicted transcriptional regulator
MMSVEPEPLVAAQTLTLQHAVDTLEAEVITGASLLSRPITMCCGADLMSDVLAYSKSGSLLLTGLTNEQVIRTAEIAEIVAICFVRGKRPSDATISMANSHRLPLLRTVLPMFESCGRLYSRGFRGCTECSE